MIAYIYCSISSNNNINTGQLFIFIPFKFQEFLFQESVQYSQGQLQQMLK